MMVKSNETKLAIYVYLPCLFGTYLLSIIIYYHLVYYLHDETDEKNDDKPVINADKDDKQR